MINGFGFVQKIKINLNALALYSLATFKLYFTRCLFYSKRPMYTCTRRYTLSSNGFVRSDKTNNNTEMHNE